jgi:5-methylcytosine-specific restriction endonuclease McrA
MSFPKEVRVEDEVVLDQYRVLPCVACRRPPPSDPAHLTTKGAGGGDVPENLMSLCRQCHTQQHAVGWRKFASKWPRVRLVLTGMKRLDLLESK